MITAYAVMFAALLAAVGRLADAVGRRRLFVLSLLIFVATSLAASLAPGVGWLIAARAAQGVGAAGMLPAALALALALALLLVHTAPDRRATTLGA